MKVVLKRTGSVDRQFLLTITPSDEEEGRLLAEMAKHLDAQKAVFVFRGAVLQPSLQEAESVELLTERRPPEGYVPMEGDPGRDPPPTP